MAVQAPATAAIRVRSTPGLVILLAAPLFINSIDRGNLATAAPLLKDALRLTNTQIGLLLSAFYWTYAFAQLPSGWLCDHIGPVRLLAYGLALWSIATGLTGFASAFATIFALRLLLGLGESVVYPCVAKLLATRAREQERGGANGLITVGTAVGTAFGTLIGGLLMAHFGWRTIFVVFGVVSLGWLLLWQPILRGERAVPIANRAQTRPLPLTTLLRARALWGITLGHFGGSYTNYFVTGWLPLYLIKVRGFSVTQMATMGAFIYLAYAASAALTGWLSDRWIASGASPNLARKTVIVSGTVLLIGCMLSCALGGPIASLCGMVGAGVCFGVQTPTLHAMAQTLAGPRAAGQWMGIENCLANLSGILAPVVTGMVVDRTGEFSWAFAIAAGVALVSAFAWGIIIPKVEPVRWELES
jgi:MFS family permease